MRFGAQSTPLDGVSQLCLVQGPGDGRGAGPGSPVPDVSTQQLNPPSTQEVKNVTPLMGH